MTSFCTPLVELTSLGLFLRQNVIISPGTVSHWGGSIKTRNEVRIRTERDPRHSDGVVWMQKHEAAGCANLNLCITAGGRWPLGVSQARSMPFYRLCFACCDYFARWSQQRQKTKKNLTLIRHVTSLWHSDEISPRYSEDSCPGLSNTVSGSIIHPVFWQTAGGQTSPPKRQAEPKNNRARINQDLLTWFPWFQFLAWAALIRAALKDIFWVEVPYSRLFKPDISDLSSKMPLARVRYFISRTLHTRFFFVFIQIPFTAFLYRLYQLTSI